MRFFSSNLIHHHQSWTFHPQIINKLPRNPQDRPIRVLIEDGISLTFGPTNDQMAWEMSLQTYQWPHNPIFKSKSQGSIHLKIRVSRWIFIWCKKSNFDFWSTFPKSHFFYDHNIPKFIMIIRKINLVGKFKNSKIQIF